MYITCLDLEGVLVPEIWIAFAEASGIPELKRTTRDEPDYDKLMTWRLGVLKEHGLGLKEIQETIAKIDPVPGAKEFLDKLGVKYEEQYYAESIKRYYDFYLPECRVLIEVDGDYWHSYGKVYEEMTPTQKKNARVDKIKNEWALSRGIPIIRIWEHDINENPQKVFSILRENIGIATEKMIINENKKKRH